MSGMNAGRFAPLLTAPVVFFGAPGSAVAAQGSERTYLPDGGWLATATKEGPMGVQTFPFMDIYTSHPNLRGKQGSVVCTLSLPGFDVPLGPDGAWISVLGTQTGHGSWTRVNKNLFAQSGCARPLLRDDERRVLHEGLRSSPIAAVHPDHARHPGRSRDPVKMPLTRREGMNIGLGAARRRHHPRAGSPRLR